eukprot:TRINITY_DN3729_c0_g2_i1.p1 TRINITY_DN3729_c0_g2~~TRINITY_DN3729_c0_g2_i1.p1  ORF type:complete len:107 (+),score=31.14 TRINITY_DN3729_c0_g2_i1:142-462(+)
MSRVTKFVKPFELKHFFSNNYLYAQVIYSPTKEVVAAASTIEKSLRETLRSTSDKEAAAKVGQLVAERLKAKDLHAVSFTLKRGERYHGKLRSLLDGIVGAGVSLI